jgi:anti-sigma regulatory factor (Ser/Thr protein kinase)/biotin operon repressor
MMAKRKNVKDEIRSMLYAGPTSSGAIARHLGMSRQAAHYHLAQMKDQGEIRVVGAGRTTKYEFNSLLHTSIDLSGAQEGEVWQDLIHDLPELASLPHDALAIHKYAFTEMLNNAIEHSAGTRVVIEGRRTPGGHELTIMDDGVGVFHKISVDHGFEPEEAISQLSKGKLTSDPSNHTGEGIFFTSRAVTRFRLESDHRAFLSEESEAVSDWSIAPSSVGTGTRVTWVVPDRVNRSLSDVFEAHTSPETYQFNRTNARVSLFRDRNTSLISRSEARRITTGLDRFNTVEIDYTGVDHVGQGFADELFRVWSGQHTDITLIPTNMSPEVEFMVRRATGPSADSSLRSPSSESSSVADSPGLTLDEVRPDRIT